MKIGILGTGIVGVTIGSALITKNHQVKIGGRSKQNEKAEEWVTKNGSDASHGTFEDAAQFGEIIFNCTNGEHSIKALEAAGKNNLGSKILIDVSNPLDFSKGMLPTLFLVNDTSLGEAIQNAFPELRVVKALNTVNCLIMVNPQKVSNGDHNIFICGNHKDAREEVRNFLHDNFNWQKENIIDLGDITNSRGVEQLLPIWIRLMRTFGTAEFNFKIVR